MSQIGIALLFLLIAVLLFRYGTRHKTALKFKIKQKHRRCEMITGVMVGSSGVFTATPNGALQAANVPVWSSADTNVSFAPSGDGLSSVVTVASAEASATFPITVSGVNSDGVSISTTVTVTAIPVPPPPPVAATGFDIEQTS